MSRSRRPCLWYSFDRRVSCRLVLRECFIFEEPARGDRKALETRHDPAGRCERPRRMVPGIRQHLGRQILVGYGALCAVVMALGAYAFHSVHKVAQHVERMGEDFSRSAALSMNIDYNLAMLRQYAAGRMGGRHQADMSAIEQTRDLLKNQISKARSVLRARRSDSRGKPRKSRGAIRHRFRVNCATQTKRSRSFAERSEPLQSPGQ